MGHFLKFWGSSVEPTFSLLEPRRFCDQFARANFCSLELTVPGSEWPSSRSHNFWIVCQNLEFYIPLESSRSEESNDILCLMIKGRERKWIFGSMKTRICLRVFNLILCTWKSKMLFTFRGTNPLLIPTFGLQLHKNQMKGLSIYLKVCFQKLSLDMKNITLHLFWLTSVGFVLDLVLYLLWLTSIGFVRVLFCSCFDL